MLQVTIEKFRRLRKQILAIPFVWSIARRPIVQFILRSDNDKRLYWVDRWARKSLEFVKKTNADFIFSRQGVWVRDRFGLEWKYDLNQWGGGVHGIVLGREHEKHEIDLITSCLRAGNCFFDVGANIGYFSIRLAASIPYQGICF